MFTHCLNYRPWRFYAGRVKTSGHRPVRSQESGIKTIAADPAQRMLLRCILDDALDVRLAPLQDCPGCETWMESGPCPAHRDGQEASARYLALSGLLEAGQAQARPCPLGSGDIEVIAQALAEAMPRRCGSPAVLDMALATAYHVLAAQLAHQVRS